jgi:hypothetical protein
VAASFVDNRAPGALLGYPLPPMLLEGNLAMKHSRKSGKNKQTQQLRTSNKT